MRAHAPILFCLLDGFSRHEEVVRIQAELSVRERGPRKRYGSERKKIGVDRQVAI